MTLYRSLTNMVFARNIVTCLWRSPLSPPCDLLTTMDVPPFQKGGHRAMVTPNFCRTDGGVEEEARASQSPQSDHSVTVLVLRVLAVQPCLEHRHFMGASFSSACCLLPPSCCIMLMPSVYAGTAGWLLASRAAPTLERRSTSGSPEEGDSNGTWWLFTSLPSSS